MAFWPPSGAAEFWTASATFSPALVGSAHADSRPPGPDSAMSDAHVNGVSKLAKFSLTHDLLLKPPHLPSAICLVDRLPNQMFVVDLIAKPDIRNQAMQPWCNLMEELARRPNVYCKLSSVITQADWRFWTDAHIFPFLDVACDAFGPHRIMAGSNWPVSTFAARYLTTMELFERWSRKLSASQQVAFTGANCSDFNRTEE